METDRLVRKAGKTLTTWRPWLSIKPSANLTGLLALPCRIAEFSCVPPNNEEEKTVDPDELSTTNTKLLNNYFWQMVIYTHNGWLVLIDFKHALKHGAAELAGCPNRKKADQTLLEAITVSACSLFGHFCGMQQCSGVLYACHLHMCRIL